MHKCKKKSLLSLSTGKTAQFLTTTLIDKQIAFSNQPVQTHTAHSEPATVRLKNGSVHGGIICRMPSA